MHSYIGKNRAAWGPVLPVGSLCGLGQQPGLPPPHHPPAHIHEMGTIAAASKVGPSVPASLTCIFNVWTQRTQIHTYGQDHFQKSPAPITCAFQSLHQRPYFTISVNEKTSLADPAQSHFWQQHGEKWYLTLLLSKEQWWGSQGENSKLCWPFSGTPGADKQPGSSGKFCSGHSV